MLSEELVYFQLSYKCVWLLKLLFITTPDTTKFLQASTG